MAKLFYYVIINATTVKMSCINKSMPFEVVCYAKSHEILRKMPSNHLEMCYTNDIITDINDQISFGAFPLHKQSRFKNSFAKI